MRTSIKGVVAFAIFGMLASANLSLAQAPSTFYYQTYLNLNGNTASGCTVTVPDNSGIHRTFSGADVSVVATVTNGELVSVERFNCSGGTLVSAPPTQQDPAHPLYPFGGPFVEYRIPNVTITSQTTVGFAASPSQGFDVPSNVMFENNGLPISFGSISPCSGDPRPAPGYNPIPASTPLLLLLIAIASGLIAARALKTSHTRHLSLLALFVCLASLSGAAWSAVQIILDGDDSDWAGVSALATDPQGNAPYGEIDLLAAYGTCQGGTLYIKLDWVQPFIVLDNVVYSPRASQSILTYVPGDDFFTLQKTNPPGMTQVNNLSLQFHISDGSIRTVQISVTPYVNVGGGSNPWYNSSYSGLPSVSGTMSAAMADSYTMFSSTMATGGDLWSSPRQIGATQTITISVPSAPTMTPLVIVGRVI
ncbi:MAG: hypothetical protein LBE75_07980 [Burkholderiales bacterium]|nr:hypothetical protein [Burkholderiales bacterium]